jgi:cytochrome P450
MFYHSPSDAYSIIAAPHDEAARIRRLLNYAFSDRALREQEPLMKVFVDLLIQRLHENAKEGKTPINMVHWYEYTTFDIIGDLAFGESFQCVESSAHHPWVRLLFSAIKASTIFQAASGFPGGLPLVKKLLAIFFSLGKNRLDHWSLTVEKVGKRLEQKSDRSDFMSYILKYNDERGMTVPEIEATSFELILAGSETTATLLAGATSLLIRHPDALRKVTEEVRTAYKTESEINMASLAHLKYLSAVLEESLRLYPPVPVGTPRVVPHPGETIEGRFVAPGVRTLSPTTTTTTNNATRS